MKQEEIFKKIGTILSELNEQYQFIEKTIDHINDLELELFAANTHYLAENIDVLRKHNKQNGIPPVPEQAPPLTEKFFEPVVQPAQIFWPEKKESAVKTGAPSEPDVRQEAAQEEPVIRHELDMTGMDELPYDDEDIAFLEDEPDVETGFAVEQINELPPPEKAAVQPVIETGTDKPAITVNEIIAAKLANSRLADKFELPAITDLKPSINLNDKLLYVKDLFKGYTMAYSEAIEILNRFNKFDEADAFLKTNYVKKNNWETKQATADKFYMLLRRRYPN